MPSIGPLREFYEFFFFSGLKIFLPFFYFSFTIFPPTISNELDKVDDHATAVTGPSRKEGRNSPRTSAGNSSPTVGLHSSQQRWIPASKLQRDASSSHDRTETIFRTVRSILNKLTPENFNKLCLDLLNVGITSKVILKGIVILIFDKSIDEPRYSTLYANLCCRLYNEAPNFDPPPPQSVKAPQGSTLRPNTFRRLLIAKLQDEFENRYRKLEAFDSKVGPLDADEEEQRSISKHHMLGNIKFIGELYRLGILQENIMHKCIKQLINKKKKGTVSDMAEDLECLTQIMTTCGKRLDHPKAKSLMDQYFGRVEVLKRKNDNLPSRIRFMLQDVVDLRRNNWVPRRVNRNTGPKTLDQIRQEVEEIYPTMDINGSGGYKEYPGNQQGGNSRFNSGATGYRQGFQGQRYPGMGSHFPQSPQYTGTFHGPSSPPKPYATSPEAEGDFDFFGPVKPQSVRPIKSVEKQMPSNSAPPTRHAYPSEPMRYGVPHHASQQYPMYNGYSNKPTMQRQGGYPTSEPNGSNQQQGARTGNPTQTYKSDQKPGKEIPPRFQRQKQQRMEMKGGGYQQSKEPETSNMPQRNGGSAGPRKTPIFTSLNSNMDPQPQQPTVRQPEATPFTKPAATITQGTPLGSVMGTKTPATTVQTSRGYTSAAAPVGQRRPISNTRHPTPTIGVTNVDAIQPPFQQVIDNANQRTILSKKSNPIAQEKTKIKKLTPSKAEVEKISDEILEKFFSKVKNAEQVGKSLTEAKIQKKHMTIFISQTLVKSLTKSDEEKDRICRLFINLIAGKIFTKDHMVEGIQSMLEKLSSLESEIPLIKSVTAALIARLIIGDLTTLTDIAEGLLGGYQFPLFLLTLQQMNKVKDEDWISRSFKDSKIDMIKMLPEASQNKSAMVTILEGKQLQFLFPLVHIESKLTNQIEQNSNPASIYKWIKENVTSDLHSDPRFINVLVSCCLNHVTKNSSLAGEVDPTQNPTKEIKEKERHLLSEIKPVLQKLLHEKGKLQLHALYAAQVFCYNKGFPKGLLLRLFNAMYEDDIIDEETYFVWKEDVNDNYHGKGKALFQVNAWLTWLHEAETEDDDAEEN